MAYSLIKYFNNTFDRPTITICADDETDIQTLIDTGANAAVWTAGSDLLMKRFPASVLCEDVRYMISGFGGHGELAAVYKIPTIRIVDDEANGAIQFNNLIVACCERRDFKFKLILPVLSGRVK